MRFPWERDQRRTCDSCGETWTVPYLLRRQKLESWRKSARSPLRAKGAALTTALGRKDPYSMQSAMHANASSGRAEAAEAERKLIAGLARCSACLSTDYTDTPIR